MTLESTILNRVLKLCENVYDESMYGIDDLYRIKDLVHSVDANHWNGKEWLAKEFYKHYNHTDGNILVAGGWYGMMAYQLRKLWPNDSMNITSSDMDPICEDFGYKIFYDYDIAFETADVNEILDLSNYTAIINTSCEHMEQEDLLDIIKRKDPNTWVCFQTNDYTLLDSHINCWPSALTFSDSLELEYIAFADTLNLGDFNRHMVIGK